MWHMSVVLSETICSWMFCGSVQSDLLSLEAEAASL